MHQRLDIRAASTTVALVLLALFVPCGARLASAAGPQDDERTPLERARDRAAREAPLGGAPVVGADGQPLVPGALPADATPEARAAWEEVVRVTLAPEPVRAFDLSFYLEQRQEGPQTNSFKARIRFLAPDFVRASLTKSGRQHVRGPNGDWLVDGEERVRLIGREGKEDVRQIEQVVGISRNFIALTNPATLRISRLALADAPPLDLPSRFALTAPNLRWLSVTSPDFRLFSPADELGGSKGPVFYEALLGIEPNTKHIVLAQIHETRTPAVRSRSRLLLNFAEHERHEGLLVPRWIYLYEVASDSFPPRYRQEPSSELKLRKDGINLRPGLTPEDFAVN